MWRTFTLRMLQESQAFRNLFDFCCCSKVPCCEAGCDKFGVATGCPG